MKKNLYYGILGGLLGLTPFSTMAQSQNVLEKGRGDLIELTAPEGYKSYQWQISSDLKNFVDIPDAEAQKLSLKVYAPGYYRVKLKDEKYKVTYQDTTEVKMEKVRFITNPQYYVSGGAHGYVENREGKPGNGISIPEDREGALPGTTKSLTKWENGDALAVYYFNHPKATIDTDMLLKVKKNTNVSIRVTVWNPADMEEPIAQNIVAVKGTGKTDTVRLVGLRIPKKAYYRYQLECLSGWNNIIEISKYLHYSTYRLQTYKSGYLSSPSAHYNQWRTTDPSLPEGTKFDWCYQEVMMPQIADIPGTYIMSLGVLAGYMGIQMNGYENGKPLHDVIFSMWDHGSTDEDPNLPENLRANVVDYGPGVKPERFANEGTGMKSFKKGYNWDCDTYVQFVTNCRPEVATYTVIKDGKEEVIKQNNTLVSTWYNAQDGKGWQYMSTLRLANQSVYFDSWYSFLENYNWPSGQLLRKGFYRNGYARSKDSHRWFHFNQANIGYTDGSGKIGSRDDFGHGVAEEDETAFFMTTGGYIPRNSKGSSVKVALNKENTPVDTINLKALLARVDQAVAHEKSLIEAKENFEKNKLNKDGWKVVKFSSEEASGEGSNGRASQIIDGNTETYWHSKWKNGKADYPHTFVIDMIDEHLVNGVQIYSTNGGGNRHIKACNIYLSKDNSSWEKVYSETNLPDRDTHQILLTTPTAARYMKIEVTKGHASEGPFVRINEIDVTEAPQTGIGSLQNNEQFNVSCGKNELLVKVPAVYGNTEISVFRADGACISSSSYPALAEGEMVRIPMNTANKGVYVISLKSGNTNLSKQIIWNK